MNKKSLVLAITLAAVMMFIACPDPDNNDNGKPITAIGTGGFAGSAITSIEILTSVTSIGDDAFISC